MKVSRFSVRFGLGMAAALLIILAIGLTAFVSLAQAAVVLNANKLEYNMPSGEAQQRTVSMLVTGDPVANLSVVRKDLVDASTGGVILASQITVEPLIVAEVKTQQDFDVTVTSPAKPGHYTGKLEFRYDGLPLNAPLLVELDVTLQSAPSVDADADSKNLVWFAQTPVLEFPYFGRPSVGQHPPILAEQSIFLVESKNQPATLEGATVLTVRKPGGLSLPSGAVYLDPKTQMSIAAGGAQPVGVIVAGDNLEAGEYSGKIDVRVQNQTAVVQVPIIVRIKHGWLYPLLVLIIGLLAGGFLGWWNSEGKAINDLAGTVQQLSKKLGTMEKIQADDREQALALLKDAMEAINRGEPQARIREAVDAAEKSIAAAQAGTDSVIKENIAPILADLDKPGAPKVRQAYRSEIEEIQARLAHGQFASLDDARSYLIQSGWADKVKQLNELLARVKTIADPARRQQAEQAIQDANSMQDIFQALKDAGVALEPGMAGYAVPVALGSPARSAAEGIVLSASRRLQFASARIAVALLVYLFALAVGWITLYVADATFGADPKQYITLFLWGAVVETVRGKTVDMGLLKTIVQQNPA